MQHLQAEFDGLLATLPDAAEIRARVESLVSVYPFNEFEFIISHLLARNALSLEQYTDLRDKYVSRNRYGRLFALTPTPFGITWAEKHLIGLVPGLKKASTGEHDLRLDDQIRVELKASRAVDKKSKGTLSEKALNSASTKPFLMNFQQTKPKHFDVIVWIGVWLDNIRYWVLSASEIESHKRFSTKQHRGNVGEGQLHVTRENIDAFRAFEIKRNKLAEAIREAYKRSHGARKPG